MKDHEYRALTMALVNLWNTSWLMDHKALGSPTHHLTCDAIDVLLMKLPESEQAFYQETTEHIVNR